MKIQRQKEVPGKKSEVKPIFFPLLTSEPISGCNQHQSPSRKLLLTSSPSTPDSNNMGVENQPVGQQGRSAALPELSAKF